MTKSLKIMAVVTLVLLLSPFIVISGFGFYHSLDVPNGVSIFTRGLLGKDRVELTADRVPADELRILSKPVLWMGKLESEDLPETSGLAAFSTKPNLLFAVNDSGNPAGI